MIRPKGLGVGCDCLWSANSLDAMKAGRKLTDKTRSKFSMLVSVIGANSLMPALLMITSISPHSSKHLVRHSSRAVWSLTSARKKRVPVWRAVSLPATSSLSQKATRWPASRNILTMALPMPFAPPVTNIRLVLCSALVVCLLCEVVPFFAIYSANLFSR